MGSIDNSRFPFAVVQKGVDFCIPASACAVFKYHKSNYRITQFEIMQLMIVGAQDHMPSFSAMRKFVQPIVADNFQLEHLNPGSYDEWLMNINRDISNSQPIAISTRYTSFVHIRVVIEYEPAGKKLLLFNPGISTIDRVVNNGNTPGGLLRIQSFVEEYSFHQAQDDWNQANSCRDQLRITPV